MESCERQYEDIFIKLCTNITVLETWFNRHRCASRLLVEVSEIHILRGDLELAVQNILRTIASSANDPFHGIRYYHGESFGCYAAKEN